LRVFQAYIIALDGVISIADGESIGFGVYFFAGFGGDFDLLRVLLLDGDFDLLLLRVLLLDDDFDLLFVLISVFNIVLIVFVTL
tara:strand:+ start:217 stop:468 length:252 start_codon:yes stop_codon:yes gene_type:complete